MASGQNFAGVSSICPDVPSKCQLSVARSRPALQVGAKIVGTRGKQLQIHLFIYGLKKSMK